MTRPWRMQFGLRTLLAATLVFGTLPWVVHRYLQWREEQAWHALASAKQQRDQALTAWRRVYESTLGGGSSAGAKSESAARERYFVAREQVEAAVIALHERYDDRPGGFERAAQDRRAKKQ